MATAEVIKARENDTLCRIGVEHGFRDCAKLRPENAEYTKRDLEAGDNVNIPELTPKSEPGQTEMRHRFRRHGVPPPSIRFVHGSAALAAESDPTIDHIDVDNYCPDKAGDDRKQAFPNDTVRTFEANADADVDAFKVEVLDLRTKKTDLPVEIDALMPVYDAKGTVTKHQPFPGDRKTAGTEAQKRSLDVTASKQGSSHRFRSCYLRLVVEENDKGIARPGDGQVDPRGRPKQTMMTSDMTAFAQAQDSAGKAADADAARKVEILDQKVHARYMLDQCPAPGGQVKCNVRTRVPVGHDRKRVKVTLHILRDVTTGNALVAEKTARDWCAKYVRWIYAQANMSIRFVDPAVRLVKPPTNMIMLGWPLGDLAEAGHEISVKIKIDSGTQKTAKVTTKKDATPLATATDLRAEIVKQFPALAVGSFENAENNSSNGPTAVLIVGDPLTQRIELEVDKNDDPKQKCEVVRITSNTIAEVAASFHANKAQENSRVGTPDEQALYYNYNSGSDRVDVFLIGALDEGTWGEAMRPNQERDAKLRPKAPGVNTVFLTRKPITDDVVHTTLAHEMGHVIMDNGHVSGEQEELMGAGSPVGDDEKQVGGPKRLADPTKPANEITYGSGFKTKGNSVKFLRENNTGVIAGW